MTPLKTGFGIWIKEIIMANATVSVVLVHGGFVDGSGWEDVYHILKGLENLFQMFEMVFKGIGINQDVIDEAVNKLTSVFVQDYIH
jgi:hypothetical protein